ncbi:MAG: adenylate/guanylate cyclase domain-containing protein [Nitrososphaerales archaeon]
MQEIKVPVSLIYAHFLFVDIAGLLALGSVKKQINKIKELNSVIESCEIFQNTEPTSMIVLPSGDGICIGFLQGPELPLMLALELHQKLGPYNKAKSPEDALRIRIGMNDGPVYVVRDVMGNQNIWGPGIIISRRVMDVGDEGHILVSQRMAETLRELSDEYKVLIKPLHDYTFKHGLTMLLHSVYGDGIGNPRTPTKNLSQRSKMAEALRQLRLYTVYNRIDVYLEIKDSKRMLTHHKRVYYVGCTSNEPIETVLHGIATDVPKSFHDLNIRTTDEAGRELKITSINFDKPFQKEFTTKFNKPIYKGEKDRSYTLEYDVEEPERYFENYFSVNCKKYTMSLIYNPDSGLKPAVYDVNVEKDTRTKSKKQPIVTEYENHLLKATWTKTDVIQSEAFRLQW